MALFKKKLNPGEYEVIEEGSESVAKVNYFGLNYPPSVEDSELAMADTINKLIEAPNISRFILSAEKNYQYDEEQTQMLREIANLYVHLVKQKKVLSVSAITNSAYLNQAHSKRFSDLQYLMNGILKQDPIGAYVELRRMLREQRIKMKKVQEVNLLKDEEVFARTLMTVMSYLEKTSLVQKAKPYLDGHIVGNRSLYRQIFRPLISPNFMFTRLMAEPPVNFMFTRLMAEPPVYAKEMDSYNLDEHTNVSIFEMPDDIKPRYHISPPEFSLSEDKLALLDLAKLVISEHQPKSEDFVDIEKIRQTFFNIGRDLISELAEKQNYDITYEEINYLSNILVRYTVGFGLLEVILADEKIQDIVINGPIGETPIFVLHSDYGECVSNIIPSKDDGESWATKFRLISGRPLDEANPVLDTELIVPGARARVASIMNPLNPEGLGFAIRRHRDKPWTLPLFIENKMLNASAAGLINFLIDGGRTILVAGTRSSGKTSFLGSLLVEIMRKHRIITVEDTLELPVKNLRELGYNIQPMKVRATLAKGTNELAAEEGIRTSLRMGDSSLIIGEVRSKEALALYEAMRVGALANVVAGTIHGGSPYAVFDRVVNDLGVPRTSFKATDIIIVVNPIRTPDGLHKKRRVVSITEVRKNWDEDPLKEGAFVDLMKYNPEIDELEFTDALINGESEILKEIAGSVKEWIGNWDAIWENILLRGKIKEELIESAKMYKDNNLLEAEFTIRANDEFHRISDSVYGKYGMLDCKRIFFQWSEWLKTDIKRYKKRG